MADDSHRGISTVGETVYTYEHTGERRQPDVDYYRVECYVDFADRPTHRNVYFLTPRGLGRFIQENGATGECVADVRPVTRAEMDAHLEDYR